MSQQVDIAVVGSGAAGLAAAVTSARAGRATLLLDRNSGPGGTGGLSGLTTLCGLYDGSGQFLNEGFSREFATAIAESDPIKMGQVWVLPYRPAKFREAAANLMAALPNLRTRWNTVLTNVVVERDRIVRLNDIDIGAAVDCTGTAEIARAIGLECLETTEATQAPATIFTLQHVERPLNTPAAVAQVLLPLARAGIQPLSFQPGLEPETLSVKFTGTPAEVPAVLDFFRAHISGFEKCVMRGDVVVAHRAGRMVAGEYRLSGEDVLAGRKFWDAIARGAWPIEQWNRDGIARFRYLPSGAHYEIPARSLRAARVKNLFMGGKTISADMDAIASARVMGCCLATGAAAGQLASSYLESSR